MTSDRANQIDELHDIVDQKITALIREMADANWSAGEVAVAIDEVIRTRWLDQMQRLRDARNSMPSNFISDGNEG